jgi:hypothetical protein
VERRSAIERSPTRAEQKNSYLVRVYCRTLVKKIRYGFTGVQDDHLRSRKFETKYIGAYNSRLSAMTVLARDAQEMTASHRALWPNLIALPRVGRRAENPGGFQ